MAAEYILLAGGAGVTGLLSLMWKKKAKLLADIQDAPLLDINNDLKAIVDKTPNKIIPYARVEGKVFAEGPLIKSDYLAGTYGVIQSIICREHKSEWSKTTRLWHDTTRSIRDTVKTVPFVIGKFKDLSLFASRPHVKVSEPLQASHLKLETIYDKFHLANSSFGGNLLNWVSGEKTKGFQEIEAMLPEGRTLIGIGALSMSNGSVVLGPPEKGLEYILSTSDDMSNILKDLRSNVKWLKVLTVVFGSFTLVLLLLWFRKRYLKYAEQRDYKEYLRRVREGRHSLGSGTNSKNGNGSSIDEMDVCAVCLTDPRDCVILNCGHVCACSRCVKDLQPPQCPICRQRILRTVPLYHA